MGNFALSPPLDTYTAAEWSFVLLRQEKGFNISYTIKFVYVTCWQLNDVLRHLCSLQIYWSGGCRLGRGYLWMSPSDWLLGKNTYSSTAARFSFFLIEVKSKFLKKLKDNVAFGWMLYRLSLDFQTSVFFFQRTHVFIPVSEEKKRTSHHCSNWIV